MNTFPLVESESALDPPALPNDQARDKIKRAFALCKDCSQRANDALSVGDADHINWSYLQGQVDRIVGILMNVSMQAEAQQRAAEDTQPPTADMPQASNPASSIDVAVPHIPEGRV